MVLQQPLGLRIASVSGRTGHLKRRGLWLGGHAAAGDPVRLICERLFLRQYDLHQAGWLLGFFIATFLFFYFFHPAFSLATTPVIIFLAFTIIVMSVLVIGIIYGRFEYEMESIRMAGLGMHKADVTRLGTLLATGTWASATCAAVRCGPS